MLDTVCAAKVSTLSAGPTGGRAILHAQELTYSVIIPAGRKTILQVYNEIGRALVHGLKLFGVDVALQRSQPDFRSMYRQRFLDPLFHQFGPL